MLTDMKQLPRYIIKTLKKIKILECHVYTVPFAYFLRREKVQIHKCFCIHTYV